MGHREWVEIDIDEVVEVREKAIEVDVGDRKVWLPKGLVRRWENADETKVIEVEEGIAIEKELV